MSRADVELLTRLYEQWSVGDFKTGAFYHPDVVYLRIGATVPGDAGEWHGVDSMWKAASAYLREWDDVRNSPERFIDLGDRVLVLDRQTARGRTSGVAMQHELAQLVWVRDGKIARWESYWDRTEALEGARLASGPEAEIVAGLFSEWNEHRGELTAQCFDPDLEFDTRGLPQQYPIWIDARDGRVAAWVHLGGDGHGGWAFTFDDGKIVAIRLVADEEELRATLAG